MHLLFVVSVSVDAFGYSISPALRGPFFGIILLTTLALHGTLVYFVANTFGVLKALGVQK